MTEDTLNRGLEGIPVAETRLSSIDGETGELLIAGYPVDELAANATYEESVYLLLHDRLPTASELERFRQDLATRRAIGSEIKELLRRAAEAGEDPMDALRMGAGAASIDTGSESEAAMRRAIAVFPTIVATYWRFREGKEPLEPREDLGHAANYLYLLTGEEPDHATVRGLETYLNTVIDHGLNASTFTARVVMSTESDVISAATAAVGALKGPLHGGAPGPVLDMFREVHTSGDPEAYVTQKLEAGERLMGFGHRVYRVRDPRAAVLAEAAERLYADTGEQEAFFETVQELEDVAVAQLAEHKPERRLETNVEYYTAALLHGVGVPRDLFATTFAISRVGGWMAHCEEQRADNRLIRPSSRYDGARDRTWTPVDER